MVLVETPLRYVSENLVWFQDNDSKQIDTKLKIILSKNM